MNAPDEMLREWYGAREFADGVGKYVLTEVPDGLCRRAMMLVWRRRRGGLERHCVVAQSELLRMHARGGLGLHAWRETEPAFTWGRYEGEKRVYRGTQAAARADADAARRRTGYCMVVERHGGHVVIDAAKSLDAFLRYVNDPFNLGVRANASFAADGRLLAEGGTPSFVVGATPADNTASEIVAEYAANSAEEGFWREESE